MESLLRSRRIRRSNSLPTSRITCLRPRNERSMRRKYNFAFFKYNQLIIQINRTV
ncbi:unnamed protein product [Onchocerca flexuosa]|nr:unnamed protein product [Onchocerca flexuosa]